MQTNRFSLSGTIRYRANVDRYYIKYRGVHMDHENNPTLVHSMLLRIEAAPAFPAALSTLSDLVTATLHGYLGPSGILYVESVTP